jgi:Protein of unknown function (DUF3237)
LQTRLICRVRGEISMVQEIGQLAGGRRRVVVIAGGWARGPHLDAEILPGGADWQLVASDGSVSVEARYTLRASDGGLILVHARGVRNGEPDVLARLGAGEEVDASEYYFRTHVTLEAEAPAHAWVNGRLFFGVAAREPQAVLIDLYEIC